ncbi:MAG TPA: CoA pyrophosphatase [Blastocatellia bacterium]|nr:CoA pyrophosphatase [Blastocatellia bacterium]
MSRFDLLCEELKSKLADAGQARPVNADIRQAAVALILRRHLDAAELLMIKRAIIPGDHWSGNLALPGGRWQPEDKDLLFTAMRETYEEVGISLPAGGQPLGRLETIQARNPLIPKIDVTPFVFAAPPAYYVVERDEQARPLALNHEVAAAFWVSVDYLKSRGPSELFELMVDGGVQRWPAYSSEHGLIWGMTERMLTSFLALVS